MRLLLIGRAAVGLALLAGSGASLQQPKGGAILGAAIADIDK